MKNFLPFITIITLLFFVAVFFDSLLFFPFFIMLFFTIALYLMYMEL